MKHVIQFQYTDWHFHFSDSPNRDVPRNMATFMKYLKEIRAERKGTSAPVLVQCSDGNGRAGAFILADVLMARIEANLPISPEDMREIVINVREQRPIMVDTAEQYKSMGEIVLTNIAPKNVCPLASKLQDAQTQIKDRKPIAEKLISPQRATVNEMLTQSVGTMVQNSSKSSQESMSVSGISAPLARSIEQSFEKRTSKTVKENIVQDMAPTGQNSEKQNPKKVTLEGNPTAIKPEANPLDSEPKEKVPIEKQTLPIVSKNERQKAPKLTQTQITTITAKTN